MLFHKAAVRLRHCLPFLLNEPEQAFKIRGAGTVSVGYKETALVGRWGFCNGWHLPCAF